MQAKHFCVSTTIEGEDLAPVKCISARGGLGCCPF